MAEKAGFTTKCVLQICYRILRDSENEVAYRYPLLKIPYLILCICPSLLKHQLNILLIRPDFHFQIFTNVVLVVFKLNLDLLQHFELLQAQRISEELEAMLDDFQVYLFQFSERYETVDDCCKAFFTCYFDYLHMLENACYLVQIWTLTYSCC